MSRPAPALAVLAAAGCWYVSPVSSPAPMTPSDGSSVCHDSSQAESHARPVPGSVNRRLVASFNGEVREGAVFEHSLPDGAVFRLEPRDRGGWDIVVNNRTVADGNTIFFAPPAFNWGASCTYGVPSIRPDDIHPPGPVPTQYYGLFATERSQHAKAVDAVAKLNRDKRDPSARAAMNGLKRRAGSYYMVITEVAVDRRDYPDRSTISWMRFKLDVRAPVQAE